MNNRAVQRFFIKNTSYWFIILGIWSFTEASIWFIAPDFLLFPLIILIPNQHKQLLSIAILGSILGGIGYWIFLNFYPETGNNLLINTPFVSKSDLEMIQSLYENKGVSAVLQQAYSFVPFKAWTYLALQQSFPPVIYFMYAFVSRFFRMFFVALLGMAITKRLKK